MKSNQTYSFAVFDKSFYCYFDFFCIDTLHFKFHCIFFFLFAIIMYVLTFDFHVPDWVLLGDKWA